MKTQLWRMSVVAPMLLAMMALGCSDSSSDSSKTVSSGNGNSTASNGKSSNGEKSGSSERTPGSGWEGYPDVPYVDIMTDVDGIEIPRLKDPGPGKQASGEIPADVGNSHAKQNPGEPASGGTLVVRFSSEPKTLNSMTEQSAVQHIIAEYFMESLAKLNKGTMDRDPLLAEKWLIEDSVKLSANYKGKERRIAKDGEEPATELSITYKKAANKGDKDPVVTLTTSGLDGKMGDVWVGLFPTGEGMEEAPKSGYHFWSDKDGKLEVQSIVPGKYSVRVGAEVFGKTEKADDGTLTVTPLTDGNPLQSELQSADKKSLTLAKDEYSVVHRETIYTYFLRKDAKWSDGTTFTTKDIEFAYAVMNNQYVDNESLRVYYSDLIRCNALDDHTIRMQYRQQYFLSFDFTADLTEGAPPWHQFEAWFKEQGKTLTLERLTPEEEAAQKKVSAHGQVFGKFFNTDDRYNLTPLGTGPYIVDKFVKTDRVELRRNPNYWNKEKRPAYLDRIIIKFIPDDTTALQALKAGEIDFFYRMNAEQYINDLEGPPDWFRDKYVKAEWFVPTYSYFAWNHLKPMFQDRRVRIALSMLFERKKFVQEKLNNAARLVSGGQYYFGIGYDHQVGPIGYDMEAARELLADAGWVDTDDDGVLDKDGEKFEFTMMFPKGKATVTARAALLQKSLKEAGIKMEIRNLEWASFIDKMKAKDYDAVTLSWISPPESDPFQIWHGSGAGPEKRGSNFVSFANPQLDSLIEQLRLTLDKEKRRRIHWSIHRILDQEQPYLFLYTPKDFGSYHRRYQGVKWYPIRPGFNLTEWYIPKDQQGG